MDIWGYRFQEFVDVYLDPPHFLACCCTQPAMACSFLVFFGVVRYESSCRGSSLFIWSIRYVVVAMVSKLSVDDSWTSRVTVSKNLPMSYLLELITFSPSSLSIYMQGSGEFIFIIFIHASGEDPSCWSCSSSLVTVDGVLFSVSIGGSFL